MRENNKRDDLSSFTPLHFCCKHPGNPITCSLAASLFRNGANVNAYYSRDDQDGRQAGSPIFYAVKQGFSDMVWKLIFAGADLNIEVFVDGFPHTIWEMCNSDDVATQKALFHFWEPDTHIRHPKKVRDAIVCVMLIARRQNWGFDAPIFRHLLSFIAYDWLDYPKKLSEW